MGAESSGTRKVIWSFSFLPFTTSLTHFPLLALVCGSVVSDCSSFFLGSGMSCVRGCLQWARRFAPPFFSFSFLDFQAVFACAYAVSFRTWTVYLVCSILVVANIRPVYKKKQAESSQLALTYACFTSRSKRSQISHICYPRYLVFAKRMRDYTV